MKKGRHRRYEEARALKRNQDLDIDEIFESLDTGAGPVGEEGYSPAFEAWAEEFPSNDVRDAGHEEIEAGRTEPSDEALEGNDLEDQAVQAPEARPVVGGEVPGDLSVAGLCGTRPGMRCEGH